MFPVAVWILTQLGLSTNAAIGIALVVLLALDWYFDFSAVMALMAPVIPIGGMTLGLFTSTEAAVAAVIWSLFLGLVRYCSMTMRALAKGPSIRSKPRPPFCSSSPPRRSSLGFLP